MSVFSERDRAYVRANFATVEEVCTGRQISPDELRRLMSAGRAPRPSYVLDDGTEFVPRDYFRLADEAGGFDRLEQAFAARYRAAGGAVEELESTWHAYLAGTYGVCVRESSVEAIVAKNQLVDRVEALLLAPRPDTAAWCDELRDAVDALDRLERDFSPDFDRNGRFPQPPSRDRRSRTARRGR